MRQLPRGSRRPENGRRREYDEDEEPEGPRRVARRSGTNPATIAIAIVGVGLLLGLILIVAGKREKLIERELPREEAAAPRPTEDALLLRLDRLKSSAITPREGLRELAALLDEAKLPETKQAIRAVRDTSTSRSRPKRIGRRSRRPVGGRRPRRRREDPGGAAEDPGLQGR